jgi:hypothetical protein
VASGCLLLWFCGDGWADPLGELALIGRAAETEIVGRLLGDSFSGRSGVLVLTGEAGAGKSALLAYARARADRMGVLQTAGVQSEAEIEFAALYQLLRPVSDWVGSLPPPQSAALAAALGVEPGRPASRFLIGAAVLGVLSAAAGDRPLLCLVDDAGWLDYESAVALAFAARRLEAEAVVVIAAARSVAGTPFAGFPTRQIEGLSRSQAETLLAARHPLVDPLIRERLIECADGNPLALLEFANKLQDAAQLASPFAVSVAPLPSSPCTSSKSAGCQMIRSCCCWSSYTAWPSWPGWPPYTETSPNPAAARRKPWNTPSPTACILLSAPLSSRTAKSMSASATRLPRWSGLNR